MCPVIFVWPHMWFDIISLPLIVMFILMLICVNFFSCSSPFISIHVVLSSLSSALLLFVIVTIELFRFYFITFCCGAFSISLVLCCSFLLNCGLFRMWSLHFSLRRVMLWCFVWVVLCSVIPVRFNLCHLVSFHFIVFRFILCHVRFGPLSFRVASFISLSATLFHLIFI